MQDIEAVYRMQIQDTDTAPGYRYRCNILDTEMQVQTPEIIGGTSVGHPHPQTSALLLPLGKWDRGAKGNGW